MSLYRKAGVKPKPLTIFTIVKRDYVRSPALREAYRLLPCQNCGTEDPDAGVCCAHSNWGVHGKGGHIRADDNRAASLCWKCHSLLDQGSLLDELARKTLWWGAHVKSVYLLISRNLWPMGVPVPDVSSSPWPEVA